MGTNGSLALAQVWSQSRIWAFGQARDRREEEKREKIEKEREKQRAKGREGEKERGEGRLNLIMNSARRSNTATVQF